MEPMRASTRVTIKDIAQRAGVSKTTVSFAFNEPAKLSSSTCTRVLAMAAALGYVPDPVARTLTTRRTGSVGILLPQPVQEAARQAAVDALVAIDGHPGDRLSNVGIDDEAAAHVLMKYVLGFGHRRLAVVELAPEVYNDGAGLADDAIRIFRVDCSLSGGMAATLQIRASVGRGQN